MPGIRDRARRTTILRVPREDPRVITYLQAIVMGVMQGVTELFPISSLPRP